MKLLSNYGHYLGLPTTLDLVTDDEELWEEFVQQHLHTGRNLSDENRGALFRVAQARRAHGARTQRAFRPRCRVMRSATAPFEVSAKCSPGRRAASH